MRNKIKELELDLNELKFILKEIDHNPQLIAIARRHVARFIGSLEELQKDLDRMPEPTISDSEEPEPVSPVPVSPVEEPSVKTPSSAVLGEQLKPSAELAKSLSLNDTFRFSRELFEGDTEKMNRTLLEISRMETLADVVSYLSAHTHWDEENEAAKDFIELLKKFFV